MPRQALSRQVASRSALLESLALELAALAAELGELGEEQHRRGGLRRPPKQGWTLSSPWNPHPADHR